MEHTSLFENPTLYSMRALALAVIDRVEFRHHGIGVLQGYVRENVEPEIRLHIWCRRLLKPGMDVSGDVHDHRFYMVSHVLYGRVMHEELNEVEDENGDHTMMALTHARAASETLYHGPTTALAGRYRVTRKRYTISAGSSYSFPAQRFHHSPLPDSDDVSVTCVEKWGQRDVPARLLYPMAHEPVMAFGHTPDEATIREIVSIAKHRLQGS